jgi:hypothetical protein
MSQKVNDARAAMASGRPAFAIGWIWVLAAIACGPGGTTWIGREPDGPSSTDAGIDVGGGCKLAGPGDACTSLPPRVLPELVVEGNRIVQGGRSYHLYAISRGALLWGDNHPIGCNGDDHFHDTDLDLMKSWNINAVRIGLSQARWFGRACDVATYALRIDHAVEMANAHGLYAILELHWNDVGGRAPCDGTCFPGLQPMPDADSVQFWREVAARYGSNPGVVFDVFNEPAPPSASEWSCWKDGGCTVDARIVSGVTYVAAGMQALVDAVRTVAPKTVVIVAGPDSAEDLSGVAQGSAIAGAQVVYAVHMYKGRNYGPADWLARFGSLAATYPIMATELGSFDCSDDETMRLLDYLDAPLTDPTVRISWGIRAWNEPGNCALPSVIADWNGTPLGAQGQTIRARFQSYGHAVDATTSP